MNYLKFLFRNFWKRSFTHIFYYYSNTLLYELRKYFFKLLKKMRNGEKRVYITNSIYFVEEDKCGKAK